MIVACGGCGARFHMDPALFQGARGVRIRCRRCGERIELLNPEAPPASAPTAEPEIPAVFPGIEADPTPKPETAGAATPEPPAVPTPGPSDRRTPRWRTVLLAVSVILLLAGGVFLLRDAKSARDLLRNLFPPSAPGNAARAVPSAGAVGKPAYEIRDMDSFHAEAYGGGKLFVIQGTVANVGNGPSRGILLRATLLGKDNQALLDNAVFAGNRVDNTTLRHADREVILKILNVRYGAGNANRDIPAGSSLPFMAVFFDPPARFESFAVKAADAE